MKNTLQQRLQSLKTEYSAGQTMLSELETKQANLRDTLLRISGAIQVLEELLTDTPAETLADSDTNTPADTPADALIDNSDSAAPSLNEHPDPAEVAL